MSRHVRFIDFCSRLARAAIAGAFVASIVLPARAGGPLSLVNNQPVVYPNGGASLTLNLDQGTLGARSNAQATAIVQTAIAMWNGVSTSTMRLVIGPQLPNDYTASNYSGVYQKYSDGLNPVIFDTNGSITDALFGVGAKSNILGFAGSAYYTSGSLAGKYREGQAIINGYINISDATLTEVLAHEIGHFFGLDHSQLDSTQGLASNNYVLMYPIAYRTLPTLHEDDVAAVTSLYPAANVASTYGQLTGAFTTAAGAPILGANIWVREVATGKVYSVVSDFLTQGSGYFRLFLPPGTYTLNAESIATNFTGGSGVGPYSNSAGGASFQPPHPIPPVALGGGAPQQIVISAGCVATATFRLDGTGSASGNCGGSAPAPTTTTLITSGSPATVGSAVTFTATVTGSAPTGSVSFKDGGTTIASCGAVALSGSGNSRTAVCSSSALVVGVHSIVADYGGNAANAASTSNTVSQVITGATPTASASFVRSDVATHGNWKGVYGSEGYAIFGDSTNYPAYAQVTATGKGDYTWAAQPDADPRATQRAASGRIAACWFGASFNIDVNLTDSATHRVALYLLDWDSNSRITRVEVLDAGTQQVLATQTVSSYHDGVYLVWDLKGHVVLRVTNLGGANAVLSALFFDSPGGAPTTFSLSGLVSVGATPLAGVHFAAPGGGSCPDSDSSGQYTCTVPSGWSGTVTPSLTNYTFAPPSRSYSSVAANQSGQNYAATATTPSGPSASFVRSDVATHGNWKGVYGSEGYAIFGDSTNYPAYAQVTATGKADYTWAAQPDADPRATQRAASGRIAACWFSGTSFNVDVNLTDSAIHRVALYLLDWDSNSRITRVEVLDAGTQQVLATQTVSASHDGVYLVWDLKGHVVLRVTNLGGANAVLSALFFDSGQQ